MFIDSPNDCPGRLSHRLEFEDIAEIRTKFNAPSHYFTDDGWLIMEVQPADYAPEEDIFGGDRKFEPAFNRLKYTPKPSLRGFNAKSNDESAILYYMMRELFTKCNSLRFVPIRCRDYLLPEVGDYLARNEPYTTRTGTIVSITPGGGVSGRFRNKRTGLHLKNGFNVIFQDSNLRLA